MGSPAKDLMGKAFGHWTVTARTTNVGTRTAWHCRCECGQLRVIIGKQLLRQPPKCRVCHRGRSRIPSNRVEMVGQALGPWTVLAQVASDEKGALWNCRCECGRERVINGNALRRRTPSCLRCGRCGDRVPGAPFLTKETTAKLPMPEVLRAHPIEIAPPAPEIAPVLRIRPAPLDVHGYVARCRACQRRALFVNRECGCCGMRGTEDVLPHVDGRRCG